MTFLFIQFLPTGSRDEPNINISERDVKEGSDEQAALSAASDAQIKLMDALPDDLKPLLNNLNAANDSLLDATSREMFEQGFQYGTNPCTLRHLYILWELP